MVWLIYPGRKFAEMLMPDEHHLLPGFSVNVAGLLPPT
jgi:hypothetical protein